MIRAAVHFAMHALAFPVETLIDAVAFTVQPLLYSIPFAVQTLFNPVTLAVQPRGQSRFAVVGNPLGYPALRLWHDRLQWALRST